MKSDTIRKIAVAADAWCDQNWLDHPSYDAKWEEKFAELIIRECADIATINAHQWESPGTYVLKHFGIE